MDMFFQGAKFEHIPGRNTFRMGDKWASLSPGQEVNAVDLNGNSLGELRVYAVYKLRLGDALRTAARYNHGVVEFVGDGLSEGDEAAADYLRDVLRDVYPALDLGNDAQVVTVVVFDPA